MESKAKKELHTVTFVFSLGGNKYCQGLPCSHGNWEKLIEHSFDIFAWELIALEINVKASGWFGAD